MNKKYVYDDSGRIVCCIAQKGVELDHAEINFFTEDELSEALPTGFNQETCGDYIYSNGAVRFEAVPNEVLVGGIREKRDELLSESDWTQVPDSPLSDAKKAEWATYRQALRDMTEGYIPVENPVYPTPPQ